MNITKMYEQCEMQKICIGLYSGYETSVKRICTHFMNQQTKEKEKIPFSMGCVIKWTVS